VRTPLELLAGHPDLCACLDALAGQRVACWGSDAVAAAWLAVPRVARLVSRIADRDPGHWGRRLAGIAIESPKALRERLPQAIVVAGEAADADLAELVRRGVSLVRLPAPQRVSENPRRAAAVPAASEQRCRSSE
jgi:hypothetical protein